MPPARTPVAPACNVPRYLLASLPEKGKVDESDFAHTRNIPLLLQDHFAPSRSSTANCCACRLRCSKTSSGSRRPEVSDCSCSPITKLDPQESSLAKFEKQSHPSGIIGEQNCNKTGSYNISITTYDNTDFTARRHLCDAGHSYT